MLGVETKLQEEYVFSGYPEDNPSRSNIGAHGSCVQHHTFWPAVHKTIAVMAQDQRAFPMGQPILYDQGYMQMSFYPCYVEESLVPVPGPGVKGILSSKNSDVRCIPRWLGSIISLGP